MKYKIDNLVLSLKNELRIRNYSLKTQKAYISHIKRFLLDCSKNVEKIVKDDIQKYLLKQIDEGKSSIYIDQAISALRFLFVDINKTCGFEFDIRRPKRERKLLKVLNKDEVFKVNQLII